MIFCLFLGVSNFFFECFFAGVVYIRELMIGELEGVWLILVLEWCFRDRKCNLSYERVRYRVCVLKVVV